MTVPGGTGDEPGFTAQRMPSHLLLSAGLMGQDDALFGVTRDQNTRSQIGTGTICGTVIGWPVSGSTAGAPVIGSGTGTCVSTSSITDSYPIFVTPNPAGHSTSNNASRTVCCTSA